MCWLQDLVDQYDSSYSSIQKQIKFEQVSAVWMADMISPRRHHAMAWLAKQRSGRARPPGYYCAAKSGRPLRDKYALATDERTDKQKNIA